MTDCGIQTLGQWNHDRTVWILRLMWGIHRAFIMKITENEAEQLNTTLPVKKNIVPSLLENIFRYA